MSGTNSKPITHIFFEVPGVLVDRAILRRAYRGNLGRIMAQRYGGQPDDWSSAYHHVLTDWDSYYADLNLSGEDGIADMWEGLYRTTRALFRLKGTAEPNKAELTTLSRELPELASSSCEALFPEVPIMLRQLDEAGLILGMISYSLSGVVNALITPVREHFKGAIWGIDRSERFDKDVERYLAAAHSAQAEPECCLIVDDQPLPLLQAKQAGMQTLHVDRSSAMNGSLAAAYAALSESLRSRV